MHARCALARRFGGPTRWLMLHAEHTSPFHYATGLAAGTGVLRLALATGADGASKLIRLLALRSAAVATHLPRHAAPGGVHRPGIWFAHVRHARFDACL